MPAIITHYTFALETMKDPSRPFKEALLVGAQGPDPFFFFGQYPFKKRPHHLEVDSFGTALHVIKSEDIPLLAARANKEANPLYPVPKELDTKELMALYKEIDPQ